MTIHLVPARPEVRILNEACRIVAANGIEALNVRAVARAARTSTSQFNRLYETVDSLLIRILDHGCEIIGDHIDKVFKSKPIRTPEMALDTILDGVYNAYRADSDSVAAALRVAHHLAARRTLAWRRSKHAVSLSRYPELIRHYLMTHLTRNEGRAAIALLRGAALYWWASAIQTRTIGTELDRDRLKLGLMRLIDGVYHDVS